MEIHPDIQIEVPDSIGSSGGIRKVAEGKCELGRVAREIKEKEKRYNLHYKPLAYSAVVFIANNNVGVETLSTDQIIDILYGRIINWQDVGGKDAPIYIANREVGDSSRTVLERVIPSLKENSTWMGKTIYTTKETVDTVILHKNTLAYAPLAMVRKQKAHIIKYNTITPTTDNIKSGRYPLVVKLGLVWKGELSQTVQEFFDYVFSPSAQTIFSETSVVAAQ